jgi:hypothetical protein
VRPILIAGIVGTLAASSAGAWAFQAPVEAKDDPLVCTSEAKTGTRFARRTCIRASERAARADQQQRDADALAGRPMINNVQEECKAAQQWGPFARC